MQARVGSVVSAAASGKAPALYDAYPAEIDSISRSELPVRDKNFCQNSSCTYYGRNPVRRDLSDAQFGQVKASERTWLESMQSNFKHHDDIDKFYLGDLKPHAVEQIRFQEWVWGLELRIAEENLQRIADGEENLQRIADGASSAVFGDDVSSDRTPSPRGLPEELPMLEDRAVSRPRLPPPAVPLSPAVSSASASDPELPVQTEALPSAMLGVSSVDGGPAVAAQELGVSSASASGGPASWCPLRRVRAYRAAQDSEMVWWYDPGTEHWGWMTEELAAGDWSGHACERAVLAYRASLRR